uniref:Uncharacterized protein n=1 Tax=Sphaerodactylus townsendi TaxID=933632 RepID=A0ACB8FM99_9SAUR
MINPKPLSLPPWTTACRAYWGSIWNFRRIFITPMKSGSREKFSRSPSAGKNCFAVNDGAGEQNWNQRPDRRCFAPGRKGKSFWLLCLAGDTVLSCLLRPPQLIALDFASVFPFPLPPVNIGLQVATKILLWICLQRCDIIYIGHACFELEGPCWSWKRACLTRSLQKWGGTQMRGLFPTHPFFVPLKLVSGFSVAVGDTPNKLLSKQLDEKLLVGSQSVTCLFLSHIFMV